MPRKNPKKQPKPDQKFVQIPVTNPRPKRAFTWFIILMTFVLYGNTIGHQYAFDDSIVITENTYTKQGIKGIPKLLTSDMFEGIYGEQLELTGGRYRPLSLITFALEYELAGANPMISHFVNVLLYTLTCILLFFLLIRLFGAHSITPYLATLLFLVHPIHTEVVANIKSRDEILCLLGSIASIIFALKYGEQRRWIWMFLSILCFLMALFAKETAVVFIVIIPLTFWFFRDQRLQEILAKGFLPYLVSFIIYFLIRTSVVGMIGGNDSTDIMENPFVGAAFSETYATIFLILGKYLKLLFIPYPLSSDYSYNQIPWVSWSNPLVVLCLITYIALAAFSIHSIFKKEKIGYGIILFLLPLLLTSNLIFNIGAPMGERFAYVSSMGFCLSLTILFGRVFHLDRLEQLKSKWVPTILLTLTLVVLSVLTTTRNRDWYDNATLFSKDVLTVPNSAKIHYYHGNVYLNRILSDKSPTDPKSLEIAKASYLKSISINPNFHWAHYNLGRVYDRLNKPDSAIFHLNKTLALQPGHIYSQGLLGKIYGMHKQDYAKAIFHLEKAIEYGDATTGNYHNLGIAYALAGQTEPAIDNLMKAVSLAPDEARIYYDIAITYQNNNQSAAAEEFFNTAYRLDPGLKR